MLLGLLIFIISLGLALLILALHGRTIDDHPLCRHCNFDLFNKPQTSTRCPECGRDVTVPRTIRIGHRQRRPRLLAYATALLIPSLALLAATTWITTHHIDLTPYKPVWLLLHESRTDNATALQELLNRLQNGKLTNSQLLAVVDHALNLEGNGPWDDRWEEFIAAAHSTNVLGNERWNRYWRQGLNVTFTVRPTMSRAIPRETITTWVTDFLSGKALGAKGDQLACRWELTSLNIAGIVCDPKGHGGSFLFDRFADKGSETGPQVIDLPADKIAILADGPHTIHGEITVAIVDPDDFQTVLWQTVVPVNATCSLLPASQSPISMVHGPDPAARMRAALVARVRHRDDGWVIVNVDTNHLPYDVGCEIILRSGRQDWAIGSFTRTIRSPGFPPAKYLPDFNAATVDIILRPDVKIALADPNITAIYGDEIILKNIPVQRAEK